MPPMKASIGFPSPPGAMNSWFAVAGTPEAGVVVLHRATPSLWVAPPSYVTGYVLTHHR